MDKNKQRNKGTCKGGKKCNNSKCNIKQKVAVQKHFDPTKRIRKPSNHEDFPNILLASDNSLEKTKKNKCKRKSSLSTGISESSLKRSSSDNKKTVKRKSLSPECSQVVVCPNKIVVPACYNSQLENIRSQDTDCVRNRGNMRMSVKDMRCRLQQKLKLEKCNPVYALKSLERAISESAESNSKQCACVEDELYLQKLRKEISRSRSPCTNDIKKTVSELKSEITKYRETLNKNVNFLQKRLGPNFFEKRGSSPSKHSTNTPIQTAALDSSAEGSVASYEAEQKKGKTVSVQPGSPNPIVEDSDEYDDVSMSAVDKDSNTTNVSETSAPVAKSSAGRDDKFSNYSRSRSARVKHKRAATPPKPRTPDLTDRDEKAFSNYQPFKRTQTVVVDLKPKLCDPLCKNAGVPPTVTVKQKGTVTGPSKYDVSSGPAAKSSVEYRSTFSHYRSSTSYNAKAMRPERTDDNFPADFDDSDHTSSVPTTTEEDSDPIQPRQFVKDDVLDQEVERVSKAIPDFSLEVAEVQERTQKSNRRSGY